MFYIFGVNCKRLINCSVKELKNFSLKKKKNILNIIEKLKNHCKKYLFIYKMSFIIKMYYGSLLNTYFLLFINSIKLFVIKMSN